MAGRALVAELRPETRQRFETLQQSLTRLEHTDPAVAAAAERLDALPERLDAMHRARAFAQRIRTKREPPMDITEFLLARIAEDERRPEYLQPHRRSCNYPGDMPGWCDCGLHDAECKAKRAIYERAVYLAEYGDTGVFGSAVLRHLAAVHSDHPDYDPSWAV